MSDPHAGFHPNSWVPKWSSIEIPVVDKVPLAPSEKNGSAPVREPQAFPAFASKTNSSQFDSNIPAVSAVGVQSSIPAVSSVSVQSSGFPIRVDNSRSGHEKRLGGENPFRVEDKAPLVPAENKVYSHIPQAFPAQASDTEMTLYR